MTDPNQVSPNQAPRNPLEFMRDQLRKPLVIAVGALGLLGGGVLAANKIGGGHESSATASTAANIERAQGFADYSDNSANYGNENFLPKAGEQGIDDQEEAQQYINDLSGGNDGPFGEKIDPASLAGIVATVTEQARDEKVADPNYDYTGVFEASKREYAAPGGLEKANEDYRATVETLGQVAEFDSQWAAKGDRITRLVAVRNGQNEITSVRLSKRVVKEAIGGIALKLPKTETDLDGFNEAVITEEGAVYLRGIQSESGSRGKKEQDNGGSSKKADKKNRGDSQSKTNESTRSNAGEGQSDKKTEDQQRGGGSSSGSQRKSTSGSGSGSKGSSGGGGSSSAGKGSGSGSKGSNGGGGSGKKGGSGGGKGGGTGGGCGGSCGKGGQGGGGGAGGGQGGGGGNPNVTPAPQPEPAPAPQPKPQPEPQPQPKPQPQPEPKPEPKPEPQPEPKPPTKPPMTCDPNIDAC